MNCYKCATPIPDNSRFCLSCGADVSGEVHAHTLQVAPGATVSRNIILPMGP